MLRLSGKFLSGSLLLFCALRSAPAVETVVLDTTGFWRLHQVLKGPVVEDGGALRTIISTGSAGRRAKSWEPLLAQETAAPGAAWLLPDFDDLEWVRSTAVGHCRTPYLHRLCLRGKFTVTAPAQVRSLKLSLDYHGGAVVYLNGREVARQHLAKGAEAAEAYPLEAFVDQGGKLIGLRGIQHLLGKTPAELKNRIAQRTRHLEATIPGSSLRKGLNVLAIELVRAPYHKVVDEQKRVLKSHGKHDVHDLSWNTCQLQQVQLAAAAPSGLVPDAVRARGVQVWNSDPMNTDFDLDFGIQAEPLRPIKLVGVRNGTYSGKVVVGSDQPLRGLKATAGDLKGPGGTIAASQVRIRYALPWGGTSLTARGSSDTTHYPADVRPLLALAEAPLGEFPVQKKEPPGDLSRVRVTKWGLNRMVPFQAPNQPQPVFGAVAPVWVTVKVPKKALPGAYAGTVGIKLQGRKLAEVPVELSVLDWTLPDPYHFRTWVELIESPDTTALEYNLPLWSPRHWEMIDRSLSLIGELGSKVLYIPLIAETNLGNAESMVRWVKKRGDRYEHDFSIMEKYLDLAEERLGKPRFVVLNVWDRCLLRKGNARRSKNSYKLARDGPLVTVVGQGGKAENLMLPSYTEPESKALWKPLFDELRKRMARRGLGQALLLGMVSDFWATREQAAFLKEVSGDLAWVNACHYYQKTFHRGLAGFGYQASYFGFSLGRRWEPDPNEDFHALFERVPLDKYPPAKWRFIAEQAISGNRRGVGRLGADTWYAIKDRKGRRRGRAWQRWPAADWGYLNANSAVLAAGPDGPVSTMSFEALREGVQECEAIILLKEALADGGPKGSLREELAKRCEAALAERHRCMLRSYICWHSGPRPGHDIAGWRGTPSPNGYTWYLGSGWQARSEELYRLAGEVQKKLGGK